MTDKIFDCFDSTFKNPFGAIRRHQLCIFNLRFSKGMNITELTLVMFRPGFKERFIPLTLNDGDASCDIYYCTFIPGFTGLHQYYFTLVLDGRRRYIKRRGASEGVFEGEELFQITVFDENLFTPHFIRGGVMYQIFPDRFYKSGKEHENVPSDRIIHENWEETPLYRPDEKGVVRNNDYYGGDLQGIIEKLPYIKSLGTTCIYLNPIFEAHENHRYNTANYEKVDPLLGTNKDFTELCDKAREMGIDIILDGVFSHTGADSIYFNKFGRYGDRVGAFRDPNSEYKEWYSFVRYPDQYESWWGITTLPNVNENNPKYTEYICGEGGILQRWIDRGAKGWRLDVADELPDDFLDNLNKAVKAKGEDKIIYGEVWEDASNKESYGVRRRYLVGGQLDSVMNYPFKECILNYVKTGEPNAFREGILTILEHYPKPSIDMLMNFLSTHDTERALTRLGGDEVGWHDKSWQAERYMTPSQYVYAVTLMKCAMVLQFFLPGIPSVYYGDEAGMEGYRDPFNRRCYPWGNENLDLISHVRELSEIRKMSRAFAQGDLEFIEVSENVCAFLRIDKITRDAVMVFLNRSTKGHTFTIKKCAHKLCKIKAARLKHSSQELGDTITVSPFDYAVLICKG